MLRPALTPLALLAPILATVGCHGMPEVDRPVGGTYVLDFAALEEALGPSSTEEERQPIDNLIRTLVFAADGSAVMVTYDGISIFGEQPGLDVTSGQWSSEDGILSVRWADGTTQDFEVKGDLLEIREEYRGGQVAAQFRR